MTVLLSTTHVCCLFNIHDSSSLNYTCLFVFLFFLQFFQQKGIPYDPEYLFRDCEVSHLKKKIKSYSCSEMKPKNVCVVEKLVVGQTIDIFVQACGGGCA